MKLNTSVRKFEINNISMIGNFNNGSIIGLDSTGIEFINKLEKNPNIDINNINEEEKELLVAMQEREFFNNEYKCELNSAYVHVTDICNLHCVGCYSFVEKRNCKKNLSYEELKHILNQLKENGVKQIVFSGGEPFLRNDMADICKYAKEFLKIDNVCVISNGTMDYTRYEAAIPYLDEINISIDGYSKDTRFIRDNGIMEQVISTINHLKDKISVSMIATLHAKNYMHMDKYIKMSKDLNVRLSFSIFTVDPTVDEFRDYLFNDKQLVDVAKTLNYMDEQVSILDVPTSSVSLLCRDGCEVGRELISIGADGSIYPCHMLHDDSLSLGNIFEVDLKIALDSEKNIFRNIVANDISDCKDCTYKCLCGGGCRGRSWLYNNNFYDKDAYCAFIKTYYKNTMESIYAIIE